MNETRLRLTQLSHCAGCAAKIRPADLAKVLRTLKADRHPAAMVGYGTNDDAAVYRLTRDLAVVETVDFFPPVVDDPYQFGQIAAANALSDIWAMGAKPLFALNVVGFPKELPLKTLGRILAGGQSKAREAGIPILGGHSIQDPEPKYGLAVTGVIHPDKVLTNAGAKVGDVLILTKPLGAGIATTALKRGLATKSLERRAVRVMSLLNKTAGEVFASGGFRVNALTDVTGFGFLGHLLEMMRAAKTSARVDLERLPFLADVARLASEGVVPGGTKSNWDFVQKKVRFPRAAPDALKLLVADAQTNGGLLASVPRRDEAKAMRALERAGAPARVVGEVRERPTRVELSASDAWLAAFPNIRPDEQAWLASR